VIFAAIPAISGIRGRIRLPGSKSHTNRALLLAALAEGPVRICGALDCDDADSLSGCLSAAGRSVVRDGSDLIVAAGPPPSSLVTLDVRDSGTACRFLAAFASVSPGLAVRLTGSARLCERPIGPLVEALSRLGGEVSYLGREGFPPLLIRGRRLEGGEAEVDASLSSQFASALLLCAARMRLGLRLRLSGKEVSRAYVATTLEMMAAVGLVVRHAGPVIEVEPGPVRAGLIEVPGDYSSAASLAGAVAVAGGELDLENLEWPSVQADAAAFSVLQAMGVSIAPHAGGIRVAGPAVAPVRVDASSFPDAVPVLSAVASRIPGESVFSGVGHLRIKESDRIEAIVGLVSAAGASAVEDSGELRIHGSAERKAVTPAFRTHADHRIVMAATLLSLSLGGLVEDPRAVEKSYPGFFRDLFGCIIG
jgi:3-phosphoshikimate 1-carboxyvinyltransferase